METQTLRLVNMTQKDLVNQFFANKIKFTPFQKKYGGKYETLLTIEGKKFKVVFEFA